MYYEQDFILRQIKMAIDMISKLILGRESDEYEGYELTGDNETESLRTDINNLLGQGNINAAENLLFDALDGQNITHLIIALEFYTRLAKLSEDELEAAEFSREEILDGLMAATQKYGIEGMEL